MRSPDRWSGGEPVEEITAKDTITTKEVAPMIKVGKKAPDFAAPAYQQGKFISVKLSEYLGKWVLLCFYRVILPLSERLKFRQLPKNTANFRNSEWKFFP